VGDVVIRRFMLGAHPALTTAVLLLVAVLGTALIGLISVNATVFQLILGWLVTICVIVAVWPPGDRAVGPPWWLNPIWLAPMAVLPGLVMTATTPAQTFVTLFGAPKLLTASWIAVILVLTACAMLGALIGTATTSRRAALSTQLGPQTSRYLARSAVVLFWLTVLGYVLWAGIGAARGLTPSTVLSAVLGGSVSTIKGPLHPVGGITTLTQFGPPAVALLMIARRVGTDLGVRQIRIDLAVLVGLALVRSFVYAERLALLEVLVPMLVVMFGWPLHPRNAPRRLFVTVLPLLAPVMLLIFFGTFEYLRSWSSDYYQKKYAGRSYSEFVVGRVESYYATALNNGVLINENDHRVRPVPWFTVRGAWDFPIVQLYVDYPELSGIDVPEDYATTLDVVANPEFNNQSGVLLPVYDWGVYGAGVFWLMIGALLGRAHGLFRRRDPVGLIVYPAVFIGIAEMGRILYWPNGRALPALVAALVVGYGIRRRMVADGRSASAEQAERAGEAAVASGELGRSARRPATSSWGARAGTAWPRRLRPTR
jgi:hypothetical protein